jgi:hypothetical protein
MNQMLIYLFIYYDYSYVLEFLEHMDQLNANATFDIFDYINYQFNENSMNITLLGGHHPQGQLVLNHI